LSPIEKYQQSLHLSTSQACSSFSSSFSPTFDFERHNLLLKTQLHRSSAFSPGENHQYLHGARNYHESRVDQKSTTIVPVEQSLKINTNHDQNNETNHHHKDVSSQRSNSSASEEALSSSGGGNFSATSAIYPEVGNSPKMFNVQCRLEARELWAKFHELGTEMIITKSGRLGKRCMTFYNLDVFNIFGIVPKFNFLMQYETQNLLAFNF